MKGANTEKTQQELIVATAQPFQRFCQLYKEELQRGLRGYPRNSHAIHIASASRTARIPKESTWILLPRQRGLRGYHRNSHGSFDLDKEGSTDTLGIRMDRAISTSRIAWIP
jgi:hypothetical protein